MLNLLRSIVFLILGTAFVFIVINLLGYRVEMLSFIGGLVAAAIMGLLSFRVNEWWGTVTRPYKPQTVRLETRETPAQITGAATRARLLSGIIFAVLGLTVLLGLFLNGWKISPLFWGAATVLTFAIGFLLPLLFAK
ncbi:MAG: hypothetical protein HY868_10040 [Chloroflexi bacterium]|nr:hypothetical protein [Chloroflexota bacterium]